MGDVLVITTDLKALLFWASVGVSKSRGGSYEEDIENIIESYSDYLGIRPAEVLGRKAQFLTESQFSAKLLGSRGGKKSAQNLTSAQRKARATKASHSRKSPPKDLPL